MRIALLLVNLIPVSGLFSQGLVNNGARIVMTANANIYIDGATGNYKNESGGLITSSTAGGTITLLGNWTNNASNVAFSNDGVSVKLSGAAQTIGGTNSSTFFNLTLLGTGTKTLNVNTTVGGISTLTGVLSLGTRPLDLNSKKLVVSNASHAAVSSSTGYIISETNASVNPSIVQWNMGTTTGAHIYPFGVSGTQIPFTFNKTTAGASNVSVSTRATASAANTPWAGTSSVAAVTTMASALLALTDASNVSVIDRWWDISISAPVTANLVFSYRGSENTTTLAPTGIFAAQHWNGTAWDPQTGSGSGVTSGVGTVSVTGASTFSPWVLSTNLSGPLPVTLTQFAASCDEATQITWSTASENNSLSFTVEKSRNNVNWEILETVQAAGNSNYNIDYASTDSNPFPGISYYRLIQQDINGKSKIYGPVSVSCKTLENNITVFPNPSSGNFTAEISSTENLSNVQIQLADMAGKIIAYRQVNLVEGVNQVSFENENLAQGTYIIYIESSNDFKPVRLVIR